MTDNASQTDLSTTTVAVIGAGNMGGPVVRAMLAAGTDPQHVRIVNSSPASSERAAAELGVTAAADRAAAVDGADVVVLGVKPYQILDLLAEIGDGLAEGAVVVSLAAGTTLAQMQEALPADTAVERAMPSVPISVGEGAVGLMRGDAVTDAQHDLVHALFSRAGVSVDITEGQVHAFIGTAGSLVAIVFSLMEAMIDEGVREGLKRDLATELVQQTVRGATGLLRESGQHVAVARGTVTSPGGTTVEGLAEFERRGGRAAIASAMQAAADRSKEMAGD